MNGIAVDGGIVEPGQRKWRGNRLGENLACQFAQGQRFDWQRCGIFQHNLEGFIERNHLADRDDGLSQSLRPQIIGKACNNTGKSGSSDSATLSREPGIIMYWTTFNPFFLSLSGKRMPRRIRFQAAGDGKGGDASGQSH